MRPPSLQVTIGLPEESLSSSWVDYNTTVLADSGISVEKSLNPPVTLNGYLATFDLGVISAFNSTSTSRPSLNFTLRARIPELVSDTTQSTPTKSFNATAYSFNDTTGLWVQVASSFQTYALLVGPYVYAQVKVSWKTLTQVSHSIIFILCGF